MFWWRGGLQQAIIPAQAYDEDDESYRRGLPRLGCHLRLGCGAPTGASGSIADGASRLSRNLSACAFRAGWKWRSLELSLRGGALRSVWVSFPRNSGSAHDSRNLRFRGRREQSPLAASQPLKREPTAADVVSGSDDVSLRNIAECRRWGEGNAHHAGAGMGAQHE